MVLHIFESVAAVEGLGILWCIGLVRAIDGRRKDVEWREGQQRADMAMGWRKKERELVNKLAQREKELLAEHRERENQLLERLVELASRPQPEPVIIDPTTTVQALGEAISRVIQGPPEVATARAQADQEVAERWREAMSQADPFGQPSSSPYPEMDEWMNSDRLNREREVDSNSVMATASHMENGHGPAAGVNITTGRPVEFRSGEGGRPPSGGIEN